ncbi:MAG: hypothetical protein KAI17_01095 [Thiotrichaceae bacterium]|nr:hypothetical protein [Thiotrichaceae bacterium]
MMNNQGLKWLAGACGLMLMVLLMEWMVFGASESQSIELLANIKASQSEEMQLPKLSMDKQSVELYVNMVENPLFIEGRKPIADEGGEVLNQQAGQLDDLNLVGIYSVEGRMTALFMQPGNENKSLKKSEGDDVSGWLLKEIQPDKVILEQAGKEKTIMLRMPKPKNKIKPRRKPKALKRKQIKLKS